jgi:hypothetical protein
MFATSTKELASLSLAVNVTESTANVVQISWTDFSVPFFLGIQGFLSCVQVTNTVRCDRRRLPS